MQGGFTRLDKTMQVDRFSALRTKLLLPFYEEDDPYEGIVEEDEDRAYPREEEICVDCEEGIVHLHRTHLPF